jgi:TolA-binding protein
LTLRPRVSWVAAALLSPLAALAQTSPEEQARRLLEDGRAYYAQGKYKQAVDNFNTIVSGFANTASVDDALLEIGRYQADVLGEPQKARAAFEQISMRYPQSDSAPGAYYYLGFLTLRRASTAAELDDALAQFTRVQRLYPRSEWVPRALNASGLVQRKAGRLHDAIELLRRVSLEYPTSDAAAPAQFQIGHCSALLGELKTAMEEFQQVRNRYPASEWAPPAKDRITALYRFSDGKPAFSVDAGFSAGAGDLLKDVRAILMTPSRTLFIASDKTKSVVPVDKDGKLGAGSLAEDLRSLSLAPGGELVVAARVGVRVGKDAKALSVPGDKPGEKDPLDRISAALVLPGGDLLVADEKKKRVFRFSAEGEWKAVFPDAKPREVSRLLQDGEGGIVMLDADEKTVRVFDEAGRPLRAIGPRGGGYELKKPADVAIDAARNYYVADEELGVFVIAPDGRLLATLAGEELRKPKALTLDPAGAILVYADKAQRIVRYK